MARELSPVDTRELSPADIQDKIGSGLGKVGQNILGYGEALLEMPLKVPLSLGAGLGGAGYGLATEGTKEGLLKGMERGVETVKPITDLSFFEKTRPAEEHLGELWDEWITQPAGRLNAEEFRLAIKKLEKQKKPIPNWLLEAESSARAQGETLGNAGAFLLGFKRKGKKGPTSEQISKEASDIIAKEQPKITYIDPIPLEEPLKQGLKPEEGYIPVDPEVARLGMLPKETFYKSL